MGDSKGASIHFPLPESSPAALPNSPADPVVVTMDYSSGSSVGVDSLGAEVWVGRVGVLCSLLVSLVCLNR